MDPDPYRNTGKTYLGGGMHCQSASSVIFYYCFTAVFQHQPVSPRVPPPVPEENLRRLVKQSSYVLDVLSVNHSSAGSAMH